MPIGKAEMREYQRRRRTAESLCQACGISRTERYHRVNTESPGLKLCAECADVMALTLEIRGAGGGSHLRNLMGRLKNALEEFPGEKYCAGCMDQGAHLIFEQRRFMGWLLPGECELCLGAVAPQSRVPLAQLPPGVTAPGEVQGWIVRKV